MEKEHINDITKIEEYFDKEDIQDVVFDLDSTLVDTNSYFKKSIVSAGNIFAFEVGEDSRDGIGDDIYKCAVEIHKESNHPLPVNPLTKDSILRYVERISIDNIYINKRDLVENLLDIHFKDFYKRSPDIYPNTLTTVKKVLDSGRRVSIYSHAQMGWTEIKVRNIEKNFLERYGYEIEIPFYSTDINGKKDEVGWRYAQRNLYFDFEKSLIIGDNYYADILPSLKLGCKNLIWIDYYNNAKDIDSGITVVKDIGEIFNHMY